MERDTDPYAETIPIPRAVRFPVELEPPRGFLPEDPATWPRVEGRLEWVKGRLLFMPPCGDRQAAVAASVVGILEPWSVENPAFLIGGNEVGFLFDGDVRGAEGAVFRRADLDAESGGYFRVAPILAVEVTGRDEGEAILREKARWYLHQGVRVVWLVLPETREIVIVRPSGETRHAAGQRLPPHPDLPGLQPDVDRFFRQLH